LQSGKESPEGLSDSQGESSSTRESVENKNQNETQNVDSVLEKLERIDELTAKILKLEARQSELENGLNNRGDTHNDTPASVETENGERVETFRFSGEESSDEIDYSDLDSLDGGPKYEFVFGCTNCNETVSEDTSTCPRCGSNLGDVNSTLNWLEKVGKKHESEFAEDENDGFYYYDDNDDGDYDPSPRKPSEDFEILDKSGHMGPARPYCNVCGGETDYISRYDNWYCYRCNVYVDETPFEGTEERSGTDRTQVLEKILSRRHETKDKKSESGEKPLKYYAPYAATEVVTKISMVDDEKPKSKKRR